MTCPSKRYALLAHVFVICSTDLNVATIRVSAWFLNWAQDPQIRPVGADSTQWMLTEKSCVSLTNVS